MIFDRFTQADSSPTRAAGGLGVGLSLVRELVERHGGEIAVTQCASTAARCSPSGCRCIAAIRQARDRDARCRRCRTVSSPPLNGVRVLLLDRDRDVRELLSVALRATRRVGRLAGSVDEALEMLESWRPDVLVSDAASPERDAYALVGKVQSLEADRGGRIPALALTIDARHRRRTCGGCCRT